MLRSYKISTKMLAAAARCPTHVVVPKEHSDLPQWPAELLQGFVVTGSLTSLAAQPGGKLKGRRD